jgi:hypothetical protein
MKKNSFCVGPMDKDPKYIFHLAPASMNMFIYFCQMRTYSQPISLLPGKSQQAAATDIHGISNPDPPSFLQHPKNLTLLHGQLTLMALRK